MDINRNKPKDQDGSLGLDHRRKNGMLFPLLMSVLPQALFPLVGSHLMSFSFFPARHNLKSLLHVGLHFADKSLGGLECRNGVLRDDDGGIPGNIPGSLLCPLLHNEASKTPQVHILIAAE